MAVVGGRFTTDSRTKWHVCSVVNPLIGRFGFSRCTGGSWETVMPRPRDTNMVTAPDRIKHLLHRS
jgi:hypothetical protein